MEPLQRPAPDVLNHIITPYVALAYEHLLQEFNLTKKYPSLIYNLLHGFPISNIAPPTKTYIPKNHKSALDHLDIICTYCNDKVKLGHMSRPFTVAQVHSILGGHFMSSPLGIVEKSGEPGKFRIIRDLSFENEDGYSVNGQLNSDDFPTEWGTASQVVDIVSIYLFLLPLWLICFGNALAPHCYSGEHFGVVASAHLCSTSLALAHVIRLIQPILLMLR